ncbi:MAG TPA: Rieske 2Fe-2S domain-containing protein [Ilumatobacter sp.]|nr:Rieske 2Fe-2S domain-containing protein [Ilumatobacter sp.]
MRATSIGHAGLLIETAAGSILCDPWFVPAFFGSWFVFPRNDQLPADLQERIEQADYLYVSHLHGDHHDEPWLREHLRRDIPILLPGYPSREQQRTLERLGFTNFMRTVDAEELELAPGLTVAIHVETSITDGPGGDSALVVSAAEAGATTRIVNQNDCRTTDLAALRRHGPVDLHWLQHSGAIWYPMVYELPAGELARLAAAKVDSQLTRAMRYVEAVDARAVVPSAGPPVFLDDELFHLNVIRGDEPSIFPDQRAFLEQVAAAGRTGLLNIPGTAIDVTPEAITVTHPLPDEQVTAIFTDKHAYLRRYQADWKQWLADERATWGAAPGTDLLATLKGWWEPLLRMAPTLRNAVAGNCRFTATGTGPDPHTNQDVDLVIDFPAGEVRPFAGEQYDFSFSIARELVETVAARRAVDWSNSLFLSCRFTAWRAGDFNEYLYNFFKSLSVERMRRAEAEAVRKLDPPTETEPDIEIGDPPNRYVVQRRCPHRNADLSVFGELDPAATSTSGTDELVCTLHGWRFDCATGRCLTATDRPLRIRRAD